MEPHSDAPAAPQARRKSPLHVRVATKLRREVVEPAYNSLAAPVYGAVTHVATSEPCVALTFDDGPHPRWTPQVLDVLARHGAKATFFCVGDAVREHRELVEAAHRAGHAVGSHTVSHPDLLKLTTAEAEREIAEGHALLGGLASPYFRTPFGRYGVGLARTIRSLGLECVLWDAHVGDWLQLPPGELGRRLVDALHPGAIVLLHDAVTSGGPDSRPDRDELVAALDEVLAKRAGRYRFVTVPELLKLGRPVRGMYEGGLRGRTKRRLA